MSQRDTVEILELLGRAWLLEPDQAMLQRLGLLGPLRDEVEALSPDAAALAYSQAVLQLVPPYASSFLDPEGMMNSDTTEAVLRRYHQAGFEVQSTWRAGAADHLGVELFFLAWLQARDLDMARDFLNEHLLSWAPVCCLAYERLAEIPLYPVLGRLTLDVLIAMMASD